MPGGSSKAPATQKARAGKAAPERVVVQNVNVPGSATRVDAAKYAAMRKALLKTIPRRGAGVTQAEMIAGVIPHLPQDLFPAGEKAAWWVKCVHLDLEAKGVMARDGGKPLRWRRVA